MNLALLLSAFGGRWVGETVGHPSPAHIWEVEQRGTLLLVTSRWEDETTSAQMGATLLPDAATFTIGAHQAEMLDSQHFVIPGWDTNDRRGGVGPHYDVVFSRPGLAELTAQAAYSRWQRGQHPG